MNYLDIMTEQCSRKVNELFPWDLMEFLNTHQDVLLVDVREPYEYAFGHIRGSINVPRGILETAATFGYEDTVPELAAAHGRPVILACRSGKRSLWAGCTMQMLGFSNVYSLKTGIRGWNDYEQPLFDAKGNIVEIERADKFFTPHISREQLGKGWVVHDWKT